MTCGENCGAQLALNPLMKNWSVGDWYRLSIDLQCFVDEGGDFSRVEIPLSLETRAAMNVSMANVKVMPGSEVAVGESNTVMNCSS